ncbi:MAG: hypothetical protein FRX49_08365 [Trebouxia sp. A1-2]|nr:MAG: hypothetical protein FRX49_08365 [Trebouxia sp. A1-2]
MTYLVVANIGLAGTQIFGCNAVRDTLLQAIASSNKGVPVGCKKAQKQHDRWLEPGSPDISELRPNLQQEWHPDNNAVLGNIKEWDYERNAADGSHPHSTTLGSNKHVHWVCQKCPKGQLHRYQMPRNSRTSGHRAGCPYCAGKQACKCNSLETHYPMISREWDSAKNDLTPAQVTSRSGQVVWWVNAVRGSWTQAIDDRTDPRLNPK